MPQAASLGEILLTSIARHSARPAVWLPPGKGGKGHTSQTYAQWGERVRKTAGALARRGIGKDAKVAILAESSPSWAAADWGALTLGAVVVPIYPTLPKDQAMHIVRDSGATLVLCSDAKQRAKIEGVEAILLADLDAEALTGDLDDATWRAGIGAVRSADLATIIYTSGTTGVPKGVMLPHRALCHFVEAVPRALPVGPDDVWLSILPQSHVFERACGQFLPLAIGASVGWARNLATIAADLTEVRPTILLCVPRFLESFRERILDGVDKMPPLRRKMFWQGLASGRAKSEGKFAPLFPMLDKLVLAKLRERMGGRMRFLVSGGAALPAHVAEFFGAAGFTVLQGYGLTETCGGTVCNRPGRNRPDTIGEPIETQVLLAEDGELLLKGDMVFDGYWNRPEETEAAFTPDGWFRTGDIAAWDGTSLKITDRKKDLLVLGNGKNVAPQPIEDKLRAQTHIAEAVVLGDGMDGCVALLVPTADRFRKELGIPDGAPLPQDRVRPAIKSQVDAVNADLPSHERIKRFHLIDTAFSIEDGTLTPTLKVKRRVVAERYAKEIAAMG